MKVIIVIDRVRSFAALSALGLCVVLASELSAQEMSIPVQNQLSIFSRVLEFDRALEARVGDEIVIGIVYQRRFRQSLTAKEAVMVALDGYEQMAGLPVRYVAIETTGGAELRALITQHGIDVLYVAPLRAVSIESIALVGQEQQVLTLTGVADYVSRGVVAGIGSEHEKPVILINLSAARAAGSEMSSELLKLVQIVEGR